MLTSGYIATAFPNTRASTWVNWSNNRTIFRFNLGDGNNNVVDKILTHPSLSLDYEVVAVAAYSDSRKRYTVFIKLDRDWVYFDDLEQFPELRDPFEHWPDGFVETRIWFKCADNSLLGQDVIVKQPSEFANRAAPEPKAAEKDSTALSGPPSVMHDSDKVTDETASAQPTLQQQLVEAEVEKQARAASEAQQLRERGLRDQIAKLENEYASLQDQCKNLRSENTALRESLKTRENAPIPYEMKREFDSIRNKLDNWESKYIRGALLAQGEGSLPTESPSNQSKSSKDISVSRAKSLGFLEAKERGRVFGLLTGGKDKEKAPKRKGNRELSFGNLLAKIKDPKHGSAKSPTTSTKEPAALASGTPEKRTAAGANPTTPSSVLTKHPSAKSLRQRRSASKHIPDLQPILPREPGQNGSTTDASLTDDTNSAPLTTPIPPALLD